MTVAADQLGSVTAPPAPGRLGQPVDTTAAQHYLEGLGRWCDGRRRELDQLDQAALAATTTSAGDTAALTHDIMLSMALWKSVADRRDLLLATWDGGRVGLVQRERISSLIWGRMDATIDPSLLSASASVPSSGLSVSLPEACRLSDALVGQLRVKLALDPSGLETAERIRQLRAQLERIRDQVNLEPAGPRQQSHAGTQSQLGRRLREIADKAGRGGDVGGLLGPLEIEATTFERDLIVGAATRREASALVERARALRADLVVREVALQTLVDHCLATVAPAPRYAVPDVDALGPVPNTAAQLTPYVHRLHQVGRAMTHAQDAYTKALHQRDELAGLLEAYHAKAAALGVADQPDLTRAHASAREAFDRRPTQLPIARQLVDLYASYLNLALTARPPARPTPPAPSTPESA